MPVLMILESEGISSDQYDEVSRALGVVDDDDAPDGLISHSVAIDENGSVVIADVWESPEALAAFGQRLARALEEIGVSGAEPRVLPTHAHSRGRGTDPSVLVIVEAADTSTDQYDRMAAEMPAHAGDGSNHPAHLHTVAADGDSLVVVDLWGSVEDFQRFAQEEIAPVGARHGVGAMNVKAHRLHKRIRGKAAARS